MPKHFTYVGFFRRRLPHWRPRDAALFITFRLAGTLPSNRPFHMIHLTAGQAFLAMDQLLDAALLGPRTLGDQNIASMIVDALRHGSETLDCFTLHAFSVMPNHVHLLMTPRADVTRIMRSLKSSTARRANEMMGTTGTPFWQDEYYDHWVRNETEFRRIWCYIEMNPVNAGLCHSAAEYRWSSAWAGWS